MHVAKKGLRVLGIAESFSGREHSTVCGLVMRKDRIIDGAVFGRITVGGMDATGAVLRMVGHLGRADINCIMISGCVIAWFNIVDPLVILEQTGLPVIAVTYEASEGLEEEIAAHFPGDEERIEAYVRLGARTEIALHTGHRIYIRGWGIEDSQAARLCNDFTATGKIPEPLRVARLMARAMMQCDPA
ncbi:MAG TPA: DUF99 family protein [Methanoculleus sp.]|nr:DUF99 family protein [Methanoculleus sp.]